jgi:hypothetical protein
MMHLVSTDIHFYSKLYTGFSETQKWREIVSYGFTHWSYDEVAKERGIQFFT